MPATHPRLGVSSWSLHHGLTHGDFTLLELPALVADHGFSKLEICHFHLPSADTAYLGELSAAFDQAGVQFFTLLIDKGDITAADSAKRAEDLADIGRWIDIAGAAGAKRVRVIGGDAAPSKNAVDIAVAGLESLAARGAGVGVRVVIENWHPLFDRPAEVIEVLERTEGRIGLKLDFGNWHGERKYTDLPKIAPFAECTHAKASFTDPGVLDAVDFTRCLDICRDAGFSGVHCLVYDSGGDEWQGLSQTSSATRPYL